MLTKLFENVLLARMVFLALWLTSKAVFVRAAARRIKIFILTELVAEAHEQHKSVFLCFVDVKRAFDCVWRADCWRSCSRWAFVWRVIRSMLQKVERRVLVNGQLSEPFLAELGVPQGAVSSPFLYICYINGVVRELHDRKLGWICSTGAVCRCCCMWTTLCSSPALVESWRT